MNKEEQENGTVLVKIDLAEHGCTTLTVNKSTRSMLLMLTVDMHTNHGDRVCMMRIPLGTAECDDIIFGLSDMQNEVWTTEEQMAVGTKLRKEMQEFLDVDKDLES